LIPFELCFGHKSSIFYLSPFECKCFILKCGNLNKFESRSSNVILLGYTPHGRSYRVFNLEANTIVESCDVTFDKTAPCSRDIFECAGDKKMEELIFIDEELQGFDGDEDDPLRPSTSSPEPVPASTLEAELIRLLPLLQQQWRRHGLRESSSPNRVLPLTFRRHIHINKS
jgi:hypothetical protein